MIRIATIGIPDQTALQCGRHGKKRILLVGLDETGVLAIKATPELNLLVMHHEMPPDVKLWRRPHGVNHNPDVRVFPFMYEAFVELAAEWITAS